MPTKHGRGLLLLSLPQGMFHQYHTVCSNMIKVDEANKWRALFKCGIFFRRVWRAYHSTLVANYFINVSFKENNMYQLYQHTTCINWLERIKMIWTPVWGIRWCCTLRARCPPLVRLIFDHRKSRMNGSSRWNTNLGSWLRTWFSHSSNTTVDTSGAANDKNAKILPWH